MGSENCNSTRSEAGLTPTISENSYQDTLKGNWRGYNFVCFTEMKFLRGTYHPKGSTGADSSRNVAAAKHSAASSDADVVLMAL